MTLASTLVRLVVGVLFVGHGTQKLFGWFGGHGPSKTGKYFESVGLRPGKPNAIAAGLSEAGGGALLALGLMTPMAAAMISGSMITAIRQVHADKGPWVTDGGWEYPLVLIGFLFALTEAGPGALSLDRALGTERSGLGWAAAELAAAAAGSAAVVEASRRQPTPQDSA